MPPEGSELYFWPVPLVACGCVRVEAADSRRALTEAIAELRATFPALDVPAPKRAIVVGTHSASRAEVYRFAQAIASTGMALVNPAYFPPTVMNATAGLAAIEHHCEGPNVTVSNDATSALDAVAQAADLVVRGLAAVAFAGGFETRIDQSDAGGAPASVAVVTAVMTAEAAAAAALVDLPRVLAVGSRTDGLRANGLNPGGVTAEVVVDTPEAALDGLHDFLVRLASAEGTHQEILIARPRRHPACTVLLASGPSPTGQ